MTQLQKIDLALAGMLDELRAETLRRETLLYYRVAHVGAHQVAGLYEEWAYA